MYTLHAVPSRPVQPAEAPRFVTDVVNRTVPELQSLAHMDIDRLELEANRAARLLPAVAQHVLPGIILDTSRDVFPIGAACLVHPGEELPKSYLARVYEVSPNAVPALEAYARTSTELTIFASVKTESASFSDALAAVRSIVLTAGTPCILPYGRDVHTWDHRAFRSVIGLVASPGPAELEAA